MIQSLKYRYCLVSRYRVVLTALADKPIPMVELIIGASLVKTLGELRLQTHNKLLIVCITATLCTYQCISLLPPLGPKWGITGSIDTKLYPTLDI